MFITDNVRLVDSDGRVDSSWSIDPGGNNRDAQVKRAFALLAEYQTEEPEAGWHLQTRGTIEGWHRWNHSLHVQTRKGV